MADEDIEGSPLDNAADLPELVIDVYRLLRREPDRRIHEISANLQQSDSEVRATLNVLADLALLRLSLDRADAYRVVDPAATSGGPRERRTRAAHACGLSKRELEVAMLVIDGLTNQQIADRLFVSIRTIETHLSHIFTKLSVTSRVGVVKALGQKIFHHHD
jgi:DNA-binding NarL/FixJ family response regulator